MISKGLVIGALGLLAVELIAYPSAFIWQVAGESSGIKFDPSISLGTMIHLIGTAVAITIAYMKLDKRVALMESKVGGLYDYWLKRMERRDERLAELEQSE